MKKNRKGKTGITKIMDFLIDLNSQRTTKLIIVLLQAVGVFTFWRNADIFFMIIMFTVSWVLIPCVCDDTSYINLHFAKLKNDGKLENGFLRQMKIPRFMRKFYYGCSYEGDFLWVSFVFQTVLYLYTMAFLALCGVLIAKLIIGSPTETVRAYCRFMIIFVIIYIFIFRLSRFGINLFFRRRDGKEIKSYISSNKIDFKSGKEIKKAIATVNRQVDIINSLKKSGLREYKKGYCVRKDNLPDFENTIRSEYPNLEYSISRRSRQIYITICEKGEDGILLRAAVKNSVK